MPSIAGRRVVYATLGLIIVAGWGSSGGAAQTETALPSPWIAEDIGAPAPDGSSVFQDNQFELSASGIGASPTGDRVRFMYQKLSDDVRISVRVDSLTPAHTPSKAGVMIRASLQPDALQTSVFMSGDGELDFQRRRRAGGAITNTVATTRGTVPQWLGLERRGTRVWAYSSSDGKSWAIVGSDYVGLGATVYVGLAVSNEDATETTVARMSRVLVSGLPEGMSQRNIGRYGISGSGVQSQGTFTIKSQSVNAIGVTEEQMHFVYQPMRGDMEVEARLVSLKSASVDAEAGVMIRESLSARSRHAFAHITVGHGYAFDRRTETGWVSEHADGGAGSAPGWVRLVRRGSTFEAFQSSDGQTWTSMGSAEITMSDQVYVGLAVVSQAPYTESTAVFDQFSAATPSGTIGGLPNLPPTVTLVTPINGATFVAPATITLTALAADPEGRLADVKFYANDALIGSASTLPHSFTWSSVAAGSYTLTAVATDADGGTTTSAPVSITVQGAPNEPPTVALTAPANGATFTAPATITLTASASDPENRLAQVDFYSGSTQLGSATASPYAFTWSSVAAGSYTFTAVATDADGGTTTSSAVSVTVQPPPNQPPTVALTGPVNGATFTAPASITLTASASDPENRLARVDFYRGSTQLGSATASPYAFTWSSVAAGSYTLTAVATDSDGGTTTSAPVSVTVQPPPNQPPAVALTAPANGATFAAPAAITLTASASDPENRLARVDFYSGSTLLGSDTGSPYSFVWSSVPAGSYTLTAVAVDADGATAASAAVNITVTVAQAAARVAFTASTDHDTIVTSYLLEVFASGADVNTASPIASKDLGKPAPDANRDITVDETAFFNALAPGSYSVTVAAIAPEGSARCTPVAYTR